MTPGLSQNELVKPTTPVSHRCAERRQLTVMFCDLVGSTALSERIDPEDLRDIITEYQNTCCAVVKENNGHVAQYLGDGVLIYFGYPVANEDDAARAVQTGLELVRNMQRLNKRLAVEYDIELQLRVGIHTGLVVIGIAGNTDRHSLAIGTTPNIAARLQDRAIPNTVVISDATLRLVQSTYLVTSLGKHELKGLSRPVGLYRVDAKRNPYTQQYAMNTASLTPMIGRERESEFILGRLSQATKGHGQVLLVSGETGIGKSRLAQLLRTKAQQAPHALLECWGSPCYNNSFLHCVLDALHRMLGLDKHESAEEKITALEANLVALGLSLTETVPLLTDVLSIALPDNAYPAVQYSPQQRKQKILEALLELVLGMASQQTVVIIVEDLHWVDPTTIELLSLLINQVPRHRIFGLFTYRLAFTPPWGSHSHVAQLSVNRLTREQSGGIINWIVNNKRLPAAIFNDIIRKTDGTPLFVEELTKMVLESNALQEMADHYKLTEPFSNLAIPSTLHDSLMARLDRLGPSKEIAQLSATLGREFSHTLLHAVASGSRNNLEADLVELVRHELLYQRGIPPQATYTFRHALVHEVAYQSLLKKNRQEYHRKIANVLSAQFPDDIEKSPEMMAHHCTEAGDYQNAAQLWLRAGRMAMQQFANADAAAHFHRGLHCLKFLTDSSEKFEVELKLQASLGAVYMLLKGYSAIEVKEAYTRACKLCNNLGNTTKIFAILCGLFGFYLTRSNIDSAREFALQLQDIADHTKNKTYLLEACHAIGVTECWTGHFTEAHQYLLRGIELNVPLRSNRGFNPIYGVDTEVLILGSLACVCWLLGHSEQAFEKINQAMSLATTSCDPFSIAHATYHKATLYQLRDDATETEKLANDVIELCKKYDFPFWRDTSQMLLAWARLTKTNDPRYIREFEQAFDNYYHAGSRLGTTYFKTLLTRMYLQVKNVKSASTVIDKAIKCLNTNKEHIFKAETYRLKGVVLSHQNNMNIADIESWFKRAIACAQHQRALSLELRATTSYCRFLRGQKQYVKAHTLLATMINKINEDHITNDRREADHLLSDLTMQVGQSQPCKLG